MLSVIPDSVIAVALILLVALQYRSQRFTEMQAQDQDCPCMCHAFAEADGVDEEEFV